MMKVCPECGFENNNNVKFCGNCTASFTGEAATGRLDPDTILAGRYIIVKTIGRGGMGAVYKALDQNLNNKVVAIKEMSTKAVGGDLQAAIGAFKKEASMLIGLEHSALPRITDFFSKGEDRWYLVMDYIEGQTLKEIADKRGPIPETEVLDWARQLCGILDYLHSQEPPIIFRDLKPANIMLTPKGQIRLIDFGIARHFRQGSSVDTSAYGTDGFAPPEQYGENQTDARSDIYALGATLHFLLTGKDPSKNPFNFEPPGKLVSISSEFEYAIIKALDLRIDNRPKSVYEMLNMPPQPMTDQTTETYMSVAGPDPNVLTKPINESNKLPIDNIDNIVTQALQSSQDSLQEVVSNASASFQQINKGRKRFNIAIMISISVMLIVGGVYGYDKYYGDHSKLGVTGNSTKQGSFAVKQNHKAIEPAGTADKKPVAETPKEQKVANEMSSDVSDLTDDPPNITFNDLALEKAIRAQIGKPTGTVHPKDLEKLTTFYACDSGIRNIDTLKYMKNLELLQLWGNQISDISSLRNMKQLKSLQINNNRITDLSPLKDLYSLNGLNLSGNKISDLRALRDLTNLERLYLSNNKINDISPLNRLTKLNVLTLNVNEIRDISALQGKKNLVRLCLNNNQIQDISALKDMTNLVDLYLAKNPIGDFNPVQPYYKNLYGKDFSL